MSDAIALLAAIRQAPDDDAPRLVYADWLDEHGQTEWAEFIRIQCELARTNDPALRRREVELLAAHHDAFAGPLAAPHLRFRFERGFPVAFGHTGLFIRDRPGERSGAYSFYRFLWDGTWMSAVGGTPEDFVEIIRLRPDLFQSASEVRRYELDALGHPAVVRVSWEEGDLMTDNAGTFDGTALVLNVRLQSTVDVEGRLVDSHRLKRFVHQPIPGFDSFPGT